MAPFEQVEMSFWDAERKVGEVAPLTEDLVATAERELGVLLPGELLRLLRRQNGGVVADAWDACPADPNFWARDHVPFETLFGIGPPDIPGPITLLHTPYLVQEWDRPSSIVLLSGQGHWWIALDYRRRGRHGSPAVTWIDNEMDHEQTLAPDFHTFVERLTSSSRFATRKRRRGLPNQYRMRGTSATGRLSGTPTVTIRDARIAADQCVAHRHMADPSGR